MNRIDDGNQKRLMASSKGGTVRSSPRVSVRYTLKRLDHKAWLYWVMGLPREKVNALICFLEESLSCIAESIRILILV